MSEELILHRGNKLVVIAHLYRVAMYECRNLGLLSEEYYVATHLHHIQGLRDFPFIVFGNMDLMRPELWEVLDLARDRGYMVGRPQIAEHVSRRQGIHGLLGDLGQRSRDNES